MSNVSVVGHLVIEQLSEKATVTTVAASCFRGTAFGFRGTALGFRGTALGFRSTALFRSAALLGSTALFRGATFSVISEQINVVQIQ